MKLKPYEKYKDSGVEWIGDIPEDWEIHRFKINFDTIKGMVPDNLQSEYKLGMFPYLSMEFLRGINENVEYSYDPKAIKVSDNDLLLLWDGSNAGEFVKGKEGYLSSTMVKLIVNSLNFSYTNYLCKAFEPLLKDLTVGMGIPHVNGDILRSIQIPLPKNQEQNQIANFLDKKTLAIDKAIEKNKKLIKLLEEKRTSLINHVVTKGLDPNAKMKDSGVEWIGKIPEDWEINKIKNTSYVKGRIGWHGLSSDEYSDEGPYLVTGTNFDNGVINWETCHHISLERYKQDPYIRLQEGDLLITKDGTIGKLALIDLLNHKTTLNSGIFLIRSLNKEYYINEYLYWILFSDIFERFYDYIKTGATIAHLYQETFERFFYPIPSINEQRNIVYQLNEKNGRISKFIINVENQINLLEEYKKSLIYNAVTGKLNIIQ